MTILRWELSFDAVFVAHAHVWAHAFHGPHSLLFPCLLIRDRVVHRATTSTIPEITTLAACASHGKQAVLVLVNDLQGMCEAVLTVDNSADLLHCLVHLIEQESLKIISEK